jgi:N-acetyl-alpha-D-glucosaminyl L-malate synthase BshA
MKIGIVCYPTYGGSGVIATELGSALAENGHEVHFISYAQPFRLDTFSENVFYHETSVLSYPLFVHPPYLIALAGKLVDVVKYDKLDILHVHYAVPHATAAQIAQQALLDEGIRIPVVTTLHGTDINLVAKDATYKPIVKTAIEHSDGVTAVSESLRANTQELFDLKKEIRVIPNFVDLRRFSHTPRDHFKKAIAPNGEKIIAHTSNFRSLKRVDNVVRIFDKILKELPAKLLLVGDGPERQRVEQLCRELGNCDQVRFLGKQDAIEEILSVSDLFIMPSESESFGLAALEAMACKVPVISSNIGGIPELNLDAYSGFISDPDDIDKMAKDALKLLSNDEMLDEFKKNALKQANKFDIQNVLPMYEAFYEEVMAKELAL